jgi:hypothetical protein
MSALATSPFGRTIGLATLGLLVSAIESAAVWHFGWSRYGLIAYALPGVVGARLGLHVLRKLSDAQFQRLVNLALIARAHAGAEVNAAAPPAQIFNRRREEGLVASPEAARPTLVGRQSFRSLKTQTSSRIAHSQV